MEEIKKNEPIHGYKVFNPDWTCMDKQYSCPGIFEEDVIPRVCSEGMHFCRIAADCFNYYPFDPTFRVAEVIALGEVEENGNKCCTNKLEIVREVSWSELLTIVNTGKNCTGLSNTGNRNTGDRNTGDCNTGNWNTGDCNTGDCNTGNRNTGDRNTGDWNTGDWNTGNRNTGDWNTGDWNTGDRNTGNRNTGDRNTGDWNTGNRNTGDRNTGDWNTGNRNTGDWNTGDWNTGDWNTGDWNTANFSNGCFNTVEQKICLFNKPSEWTYRDWLDSYARFILNHIPSDSLTHIWFGNMTDKEKEDHPEAEITGGYLKTVDGAAERQSWWDNLSETDKAVIKSIPNFDPDIFKEITGIDVNKG